MSRIDHPKFALASVEGYDKLGLRHIVNVGPPSMPFPRHCYDPDEDVHTELTIDTSLEFTDDILKAVNNRYGELIQGYVGPHRFVPEVITNGTGPVLPGPAPEDQVMSEDDPEASPRSIRLLEGVYNLSQKYDTPIHAHSFGGMVIAANNSFPEILSSQLSLAHCTGMEKEELEVMAEHGVSASHGPLTNAYIKRPFRLIEALEAGVNVAISSDGSGPNRSFDLLSKGRMAAHLQRIRFANASLLPAGKILEMLTIEAAKALNLEHEIGSIEPGKRADIIAINLDSAHMYPQLNIVPRIVNYASGHDVEFMMVDGDVLFSDRSFTDIDVQNILQNADEHAIKAINRANASKGLTPHPNEWQSIRYEN